ncbi:hypothetical protein CPB86DRAFT_763182 [Serendipita vermifera]|nr:hypothetical protein CPB86DRAFT_763182 [Serendipita vermifera]
MFALKTSARAVSRRRGLLSVSSRATLTLSRHIHALKPLPYPIEDGLGEFLSPGALKIIAQEYQQGLLERLNEEVLGSELAPLSVAQTVINTSNDQKEILAFNYASQALNNSFFFDNLSPPGSSPSIYGVAPKSHEHTMSSQLTMLVNESFGSLDSLKSTLSAAAMGMMSSGWVWLVCDESAQHLGYIATFGPGTLLARNRQHRHPDHLSAHLQGPSGPSNDRLFRILGERIEDSPSSKPKTTSGSPLGKSAIPQTRSFHSTVWSQSQLSMLQYQRSSRVSQSPLPWGAPEPLLTAGSQTGRTQPFSSKPPTGSSTGGIEASNLRNGSVWETTEKKSNTSPLLSQQSFQDTGVLKSLRNDRAYSSWDKNRLRGEGDDILPLMCISVHEHMWMAGGYGIWGKEEYLKRFWSVVNWKKVSDILTLWAPSATRQL